MLMKVKIENGKIIQANGNVIVPTSNLDIHTWNIKIEDRIIRCKSFSRAIPEKKSVTRFPLKDSTIYLVNKINDAFCYQRESYVEAFLTSNNINVVRCIEREGLSINDDQFSQLDGHIVRYDKRVFISPSKKWVIIGDMESEFNTLWLERESDLKKFFRDKNFLSMLQSEFHAVNWNSWNIPEQYKIDAEPINDGFYRCKSNSNFIVAYFAGDDLLPNNFDYAVFNGIGKDYYNEQLNNLNIRVSEYRDFYFDPPTGESIQLIYAIDSRYWEKL